MITGAEMLKVGNDFLGVYEMSDKMIPSIKKLLDEHLPIKETKEYELKLDVFSACDIRKVAMIGDSIIGYIRAKSYNKEMVRTTQGLYFKEDYERLNLTDEVFIITDLVVKPEYRGKEVSQLLISELLREVNDYAKDIIALTWVHKGKKKSMSTSILQRNNFELKFYLKHFYHEYNIPCPHCGKRCSCDSEFFVRKHVGLNVKLH